MDSGTVVVVVAGTVVVVVVGTVVVVVVGTVVVVVGETVVVAAGLVVWVVFWVVFGEAAATSMSLLYLPETQPFVFAFSLIRYQSLPDESFFFPR